MLVAILSKAKMNSRLDMIDTKTYHIPRRKLLLHATAGWTRRMSW